MGEMGKRCGGEIERDRNREWKKQTDAEMEKGQRTRLGIQDAGARADNCEDQVLSPGWETKKGQPHGVESLSQGEVRLGSGVRCQTW